MPLCLLIEHILHWNETSWVYSSTALTPASQTVLAGVHRRLTRLAKTAEDFRDVVGAVWAPKLGAYVCAAHFLEHHLRETAAGLVLDAAQARNMRLQQV